MLSFNLVQFFCFQDFNVNINFFKDYDENYLVIFNIILWLMIVMFVVIFGVFYGMWNIDFGRDSIIYRMIIIRLKKDQLFFDLVELFFVCRVYRCDLLLVNFLKINVFL